MYTNFIDLFVCVYLLQIDLFVNMCFYSYSIWLLFCNLLLKFFFFLIKKFIFKILFNAFCMLGINLGTGDVHSEHTKDPCVYEFIGIPGRYFRFSSRLPQ